MLLIRSITAATRPELLVTVSDTNCISDLTFDWTEKANSYFRYNHTAWVIGGCISQYLMDILLFSALIVWTWKHRCTRVFFTSLLFYSIRSQVQTYFYLNRIDGFIYDDPGPFSLTIAYFDTNDFYYSGHCGSCTMYMLEMFALGHTYWGSFYLCMLIFQWCYLTFYRVHYIIDLLFGVVVAISVHRLAECVCHLLDGFAQRL